MSLYLAPKQVLLSIIERDNGITLNEEDYDFSDPIPATPPDGSTATYNSQITVTANNVAAAYQGDIEFYYNRLRFEDLANMVPLSIRSPDMATTHDILPSLNRRFGLNLTPGDIIDRPTVDEGGYRSAVLEANPTSLGWIGSAVVTIQEGDLLIEDFLTTTALGGLDYPTEYPTKTFAVMYSYWRDFSEHHEYLFTVDEGDTLGLEMTSVLNDVTEDPWQATGLGEFSLSNAVVSYAGPTASYSDANPDFTNVIVIDLSLDDCEGMTGSLVIHFSEPEDPNAYVGGNDG